LEPFFPPLEPLPIVVRRRAHPDSTSWGDSGGAEPSRVSDASLDAPRKKERESVRTRAHADDPPRGPEAVGVSPSRPRFCMSSPEELGASGEAARPPGSVTDTLVLALPSSLEPFFPPLEPLVSAALDSDGLCGPGPMASSSTLAFSRTVVRIRAHPLVF